MKICQRCGAHLDENAKFCFACGAPAAPMAETPKIPVCKKCGERLEAGARFCANCGEPCENTKADPKPCEPAERNACASKTNLSGIKYTARYKYSNQPKNIGSCYIWLLALSIVIVLDVILVPFISFRDGLIPDFSGGFGTFTFSEMLQRIQYEGAEALGDTDIVLAMAAMIPAFCVLIGAMVKSKGVCATFSLIASGLLALLLWIMIDEGGTEFVFGEYGSVSIGFWIAWILHIVNFFCALNVPGTTRS